MFEEVRLPEYHVLINPSVKSYYFTYLVLIFFGMMKEDDPIAVFKTDIAEISDSEAVSVSTDDALLMSMGKKPELKRVYNFWTRKEISHS